MNLYFNFHTNASVESTAKFIAAYFAAINGKYEATKFFFIPLSDIA